MFMYLQKKNSPIPLVYIGDSMYQYNHEFVELSLWLHIIYFVMIGCAYTYLRVCKSLIIPLFIYIFLFFVSSSVKFPKFTNSYN